MMSELARKNLECLQNNPYPGRGIVVGQNDTGEHLVQVYWIMGRSENSRNRVFDRDLKSGRVFTEAADPTKVKDPSLIIYNAMAEREGCFVVSNGNQTDIITGVLATGGSFHRAMNDCEYEPDEPNYTPRISAVCYLQGLHFAEMAILRKSEWSDACNRHFYCFGEVGLGLGFCLTTYRGDGNPLPAFRGEPYLVPLEGDIDAIAETYWEALNPDNRVALAVKFIHGDTEQSVTKLVNRFNRVSKISSKLPRIR